MSDSYYSLGCEDAAREVNEQVKCLRDFVLLYRKTYMETQVHPSHIAEAAVMRAALELCEKFNIKQGE